MSNSVQDSSWVQQQSSGDAQSGPQQQNDLSSSSSSNNNRDASSTSTKPANETQDNSTSNKKTKRTGPKRRKVTHGIYTPILSRTPNNMCSLLSLIVLYYSLRLLSSIAYDL